jgi:hypothetical protein
VTWAAFLGNIVPVTLGNAIGGGLFVGAVYWLVYIRHGHQHGKAVAAAPVPTPAIPVVIASAAQAQEA